MNDAKIWIVDDDRGIRFVLEKTLANSGYQTRSFDNAHGVLEQLKTEQPKVIVSDIRMAGMDGLELLGLIKQDYPSIPVIIMTAYSDLDTTVHSFSEGAFEYIAKPFDVDEAEKTIRRAVQSVQRDQLEPPRKQSNIADTIVGKAPAMQEAYRAIARLSHSNATVLITGESGTGKELVANALHEHSPRQLNPFVALNMAALPHELIESELFGHERGAFTGAVARRQGRFEQANQGTLFLDEIGDMPFSAQTRLLRVIAEGSFHRIGGQQPIHVDVRIIAATHQDLENLVSSGDFREDLYHRLNVIRVHVPALRDRRSDIAELATRFLHTAAEELEVSPKVLSPEVLSYMESLEWPGNVRQLQNTCHWLTVMAPGREVLLTDLPPELHLQTQVQPTTGHVNWENALEAWVSQRLEHGTENLMTCVSPVFESILIRAALRKTEGNKRKAAQLLGVGRNTLARKLAEYQ